MTKKEIENMYICGRCDFDRYEPESKYDLPSDITLDLTGYEESLKFPSIDDGW